tara:strand:- start:138 stop:761 length:624 start_codon:yes stop_codon:yes gene_type:complete
VNFNCNCRYCQEISYVWEFNKKIVWVEIPKNATCYLKTFLFKFENDQWQNNSPQPFSLIKSIKKYQISNYKRGLLILRNPIDRFKSLISHYFIDGSKVHQGGKEWLNKYSNQYTSYNDVVDIVLNNWDKVSLLYQPHHWNTQNSFIPDNFFNLSNHILTLEELPLFFSIPPVNISSSNKVFLSKNHINKLEKLYYDDFVLYDNYIGF